VVKPLLIQGGVQLDAAVLFFALIGGLALFGAVGLIVALSPLRSSWRWSPDLRRRIAIRADGRAREAPAAGASH